MRIVFNNIYLKMATDNIGKNRKTYLPFIISSVCTIMMTYIVLALSTNDGLSTIPGGANLQTILSMGYIVLIFFSAIFLFYINSFMIKTRKKEFGIYNILGMDKKHIMQVLSYEMIFVFILSSITGIVSGVILNKVSVLLIRNVMEAPISFGSEFSFSSMIWTIIFFGVIFLLILLGNIYQIHISSPIELLKGSNVGEKEPKTNWLKALLGVLITGAGYYLSLTIQSPISEIQKAFIAVLLIIIGTYFLFTSVSIAILKLLKNNKDFYYQINHFIPVSGMFYRMKKNGIGLANICIMSVGTIILLSIGISMFISPQDQIDSQYPSDAFAEVILEDNNNIIDKEIQLKEEISQVIVDAAKEADVTLDNTVLYSFLNMSAIPTTNGFTVTEDVYFDSNTVTLYLIDQNNYQELTGQTLSLNEDEIYIHGTNDEVDKNAISILDTTFNAKTMDNMEEFAIGNKTTSEISDVYYIIVNDISTLNTIEEKQKAILGEDFSRDITVSAQINLASNTKNNEELAFGEMLEGHLKSSDMDVLVDTKTAAESELLALHSGVLFLVLNLGILLLLATILTIYFKQISEAYDDKDRYEVMRKIGLSQKEIKRAITTQTLMVFFLPLIVAGIHIIAAFPLMRKFMILILLNNVDLFLISVIVSFLIFSVIYILIYRMTAKAYYEIVS